MADVREDYLDAALRTIEREFGGLQAYLALACGLGPARLAELRSRLTG